MRVHRLLCSGDSRQRRSLLKFRVPAHIKGKGGSFSPDLRVEHAASESRMRPKFLLRL